MKAAVLLPLVILAACATHTPPARLTTVSVDKSVPVSCVPADYAPAPADAIPPAAELVGAADASARYQRLAQMWLTIAPLFQEDEKIIAACRAAAPAAK